ncbi:TetR/AcrR family transcriptional regulator [Pseudomonas sp. NPDC089569]|uniref:TetR/AcrR family transcriptional regulator n=1 Tax=Pseudomonas sp. NPDC089569 TaxID=3390722 RepID=UPI003D03C76D
MAMMCSTPAAELQGDRIRKVALSLFVAQGYQAVSLRNLAINVGIQAGSLYSHIESKQCLLFELISMHEAGLLQVLKKRLLHTNAVAGIEDYVASYLRFIFMGLQSVTLSQRECGGLNEQQQDYVRGLRESQQQILLGILAEGISQRVFFVNAPDVAAQAIITMLNGVYIWYGMELPSKRAKIIAHYQSMVCQLLGRNSA